MRRNGNTISLFTMLAIFVITACSKEENTVSEIPEITFAGITPASQIEFQNPFIITVAYKDGNGDLGENNPDVKNLFVTDKRINVIYEYRLKQLAPDNAQVPIQGQFTIDLPLLGITDSSLSQQAWFDIYVTDRSGNTSNIITTNPVTILKQ